jgi:hypothetical protein
MDFGPAVPRSGYVGPDIILSKAEDDEIQKKHLHAVIYQ